VSWFNSSIRHFIWHWPRSSDYSNVNRARTQSLTDSQNSFISYKVSLLLQ